MAAISRGLRSRPFPVHAPERLETSLQACPDFRDGFFGALIMASATPAASLRGQNVQASDKYGIRRLWSPSSVAESGRYGDRSLFWYFCDVETGQLSSTRK